MEVKNLTSSRLRYRIILTEEEHKLLAAAAKERSCLSISEFINVALNVEIAMALYDKKQEEIL